MTWHRLSRAVAAALLVCVAMPVFAQEPAPETPAPAAEVQPVVEAAAPAEQPPATNPAPASPPKVGNAPDIARLEGKLTPVGPDTYILLDSEGNPQPVFNMSIQNFLEAWEKQQGLKQVADQSKQWTIDKASFTGSIQGNQAALHATFDITLHQTGEVEVPLGLSGAVLAKLPDAPARTDGRYLRLNPAEGGYLVTLDGEPGTKRTVELDLVIPLQRDGTRVQLRMLPARATKVKLVLESAGAIQSTAASEGVVLTTRTLDSGSVQIEADCQGGETAISWVERPVTTDSPEATLTSSAKLLITISGRDVETQARLSVQSYGQAFREFRVHLPPGATYQRSAFAPPIASIEEVNAVDNLGGTVLRVRLVAEQSDPVTVDLETKQTVEVNDDISKLTLRGFEVAGAVPQDGEVAVVVDDDWQLRFEPTDGVRLVRRGEVDLTWLAAPPDPKQVKAAFRFARQPWQLPVEVVPRQQQVLATPSYTLTINPGEALLRMEVTYQIEGGRSLPVFFDPSFELEDWTLVRTSTEGIEEAQEFDRPGDPMGIGDMSQHVYGYDSAFAMTRSPRITLELSRVWQPEENEAFQLRLPCPIFDSLELNPSKLVVKSDTSLQITPDLARMSGLSPLPIFDDQDAARGETIGQQFRYRGDYAPLEFAARRQPRPQRVLLNCETDVNIEGDFISVVQDLLLDIRHQPANSIMLATPQGLKNLGVELLPETATDEDPVGNKLEVPDDDETTAVASGTLRERQVQLAHPRLGKFRLRVTYQLPAPAAKSESFVLPLVSVPDVEFGSHRLHLASSLGQALVPATGSSWRMQGAPTAQDGVLTDTLTTTEATPFLPLATAGRTTNGGVVAIERIWVQTWLTDQVSQLRTVFLFKSSAKRLHVELPENAPDGDQIEVVLDGTPILDAVQGDAQIELNLPDDPDFGQHTLSLRYRLPRQLNWNTQVDTERPRLAGDDVRAEVFWQVVAPVEYQPVWHAPTLIEAFQTKWTGNDWRAQNDLDTADLEDWIGVTHGIEPTRGEHAMLYRALGESPLEVSLIRREILVFGVASIAVAASIALWYLPWLRRVPVLLVVLVAVAAVGVAYPQHVGMLSRFGLLGVLCGLLAWLIALMYPRPAVANSTATQTATARPDRSGSHRPSTMLPITGGQASTNAQTIAIEVNEPNG
ncbi:hypothetical protein [Aeoliella mucimassa]|uniref:hypothetical protein n=1 Tax=Aeoliella mucimassa TaxID=2527972 RepID=UPI0011A91B75|nr:hypothetical protein [Aeoliella mucimassa]